MHLTFASYEPDAHGTPLPDAVVRPATPDDAGPTGALAAQREGDEAERWAERHARRLADPDHHLVVAEVEGDVVGYGWASYLRPVREGGRGAPDGWYLSGVVVAPDVRRRGIGLRLTRARIDWVLGRAAEVFYVVSDSNLASRRMHESLGFREVTRDFTLPGVVFTNADGVLCRLERRADASVVDLAAWRPGA